MSPHVNRLLTRFTALYGTPRTEDLEAFALEYDRALRGYSAAVLSEAGDVVVRNHTFRAWPTPGECVAACREIGRRLDSVRARTLAPEPARKLVRYARGTPEFDCYLARVRGEDPAYARLVEQRGLIKLDAAPCAKGR